MAWKELPTDIPLDHEALTPPDAPADAGPTDDAPPANLTELPADAKLDEPAPEEPPIIISAIRPGGSPRSAAQLKAEEVNPTYTQAGFDSDITPDAQYHTALSDADKKEYAGFFKDPKNPPSAAMLRQWYHAKTGALLGNADQIVDVFRKTGKFRTQEQINIPKPKTTDAEARFDHLANALAADYGPEAGAALATLGLGGDGPNIWNADDQSLMNLWANNADLLHARLDAEAEQHPIDAAGGEIIGAGLSTPILGAVGDAAGLAKLGETNRALAQGVTEGAAYGSGAAGPGHRGEGAAIGAATVPLVGAIAKAPVALLNTGKSVLEGSPGLARRIIAKAIKEDMNTPEDVGKAISEANDNGVPMALGDTGENVRGLLAASSRASGVGRTIVRDALEDRQSQLADRIVGHIERDLGPVANPHQVADDMMTAARATAGPLYDRAYAAKVPDAFVEKLKPLLQRPSVQKALNNARRIAAEEGEDPAGLGLSIGSDGQTVVSAAPSWKTLDYIKRGMDDVVEGYKDPVTGRYNFDTEGKAVNNTLRSYLGAMDAANPDYKAARAVYAGQVKGISAMNTGRKFLNMTADDIEARMRDMSPFERDMAAVGARRAMAELVSSKGDTADIVHALVGTGKKRAMLARLFGDRKQFQRFVDTLGQEREGWRSFRQALLGSPTAANVQDDSALQLATMAADFATTGLPVATSIRYALKFGVGKVGEKAKQQVAALLSNTEPSAIRELAAELRMSAEKRGLRVRKINDATRTVGKGATVLLPQQAAQ
jgi:hypothetical protein